MTTKIHRLRSGFAPLVTVLVLMLSVSALAREQTRPESTDIYFCTTCHGVDGRGNEGVQAPRLAGMEPWYLRRQLELFKSGSRGMHDDDLQGREMQPMAAILSSKEIDLVIDWVGSWPAGQAPAPTVEGNPERGREHYRVCASCHGNSGKGNRAMQAPALAGQNDWYLLTQLRNFRAGYRGSDPKDKLGAQMRSLVQALPDEQALIDLVSYVNTLSQK
ncbi:c-type cytochrome [Proteobacteria bacterium 005FR1]|nr:c-type cytochrome [Proteobacteria bacterium 005FR1]